MSWCRFTRLALAALVVLAPVTPAGASSCGDSHTPVSAIQGPGDATPLSGQWLDVEGVITVDLRGPGGFGGFYLQQPRPEQDKDPATSEGLFVQTNASQGQPGDRVRVHGRAVEYYGLTSLGGVEAVRVCGSPGLPQPQQLDPRRFSEDQPGPEALEAMLVHISNPLVVTDTWNLARYGEVVLAPAIQRVPTQIRPPGADRKTEAERQDRVRLILDDGQRRQQPRPVPWPPGGLGPDNPVRVGDRVGPVTGVLDYRFGNWRLQPASDPRFSAANPRRPAPQRHPQANMRVVSLNLGNLFNGDGQGGGYPTPRGAPNRDDYQAQLDRLVAQIRATDADVLAVSELENDGYRDNSALAQLAGALGDDWRFVKGGTDRHGDAIRNALLYRSDRVRPEGAATLMDAGAFRRWHRPALAQTFTLPEGGDAITVVAVHLKSKSCRNAPQRQRDTGDGQACFVHARTEAALELGQWRPPGGQGEQPVLLVGDFNAYAMETPLEALAGEGYRDLIRHFHGTGNQTFRYHGRLGTLDYHLANQPALARVLASHIWSVNVEEPRALAYDAKDGLELPPMSPWRASDHNPVITDLRLRRR